MAADVAQRRRSRVSLFEGIRPIDKAAVPKEAIAGITLAALAIPEVMGYTKIAGMPVITGLYTILVPIAVFAILGSSRHLVVGADSATAAIMFAGLTPLATAGSPQYVALAGMLALMAAAFLLLARVLRLGFLADFLSRTVLIGFLTGVGIQVACGQLAGMFGFAKAGRGPAAQVYHWARDLGQTSLATLAVTAVVLLVIVLGDRLLKQVPWALHHGHRRDRRERGAGSVRSRREHPGHDPRRAASRRLARHPRRRLRQAHRHGGLRLRRDPGSERRHFARLRGQVQRGLRREC